MSFAHPGWLALLLLLPLLGAVAVMTSRMRRRQWTAFVAPRLREALLKRGSSLPRWLAFLFLLAACAALSFALARPRADAGTKLEKTVGRNVMIALDISKSMRVADVKPDRLTQAKIIIYELLDAMPNERIGMIGFAGSPYVYAPLTVDHSAVSEIVDQIDEKWAPLGGSDLASAVHLATETLKKTGQKNNALVILSDGEKHEGDLDAMITEAEQSGVYIVAIGVGTEDGGPVIIPGSPNQQIMDETGRPVISRLHPDVMRKLAEETKGRFTIAGSGLDVPALVNSVVKGLDAFEMDGRERRVSIEFYQWLMLPSILFLIGSIVAGTRWKGIRTAATAIAALMLTAPGAKAGEASGAKEALAGKNYKAAREAYHNLAESTKARETKARYRLGEATAAYRAKDFREARTAYSGSLLSEDPMVDASGHLGMGNSLFQLGWIGLAGESYPQDPASVPDLDKFDDLVKKTLAKMREAEEPEEGDTPGFGPIESLITNWADAVRHFDSALALPPSDQVARRNRDLTMIYLKRLKELLKEEEQQTQQSMPQAQPGDGPPQEGDGKGDPKDGKGGEKGPKDGKGGDGDKDKGGDKGDKDKDKDGKKDKKDGDKGDKGNNPNESPEERAKRILKENADLEKGPLTRGRREFQNPEKDW
ncbi:MAG: VWA domain-containing protein [Luteolibacter sp.]|uniref:vWA domain-containing protein n=1 Tax=Luteolibacter sp. TaxID=1962973 RepID=UPI003266F512